MGMYTELHFNAELQKDIDPAIISTLEYMIKNDDCNNPNPPVPVPDHNLFRQGNWYCMFQITSGYFSLETHSTLWLETFTKRHYISVRCSFKNYEDEIENFIEWIDPYLDESPGAFLGFHRYEEDNEPTLIYKSGVWDNG